MSSQTALITLTCITFSLWTPRLEGAEPSRRVVYRHDGLGYDEKGVLIGPLKAADRAAGSTEVRRRVVYEHDGMGYDENGTLIGPLNLTHAERVRRLNGVIGRRVTVALADGRRIGNARILALPTNTEGLVDRVAISVSGSVSMLALDDIRELIVGDQVLSLMPGARSMAKLREFNIPREVAETRARREELDRRLAALAEREVSLTRREEELNDRDRAFLNERADLSLEAGKLSARESSLSSREADVAKRTAELESERRRLGDDVAKIERRRSDVSITGERLAERERELAARSAALDRRENALRDRLAREKFLNGTVTAEGKAVGSVRVRLFQIRPEERLLDEMTTAPDGDFFSDKVAHAAVLGHLDDYRIEVEGYRITLLASVAGRLRVLVNAK